MLYCGFSQADITPKPEEVYLDGYGHRVTPAEGVRDPLYVKVWAIRSGTDVFVVVAFDVCGFNNELKERLRGYIKSFTGLIDGQFAICATHTHAGPACGVLQDLPINNIYWNQVALIASETIKKAISSVCEGRLRFEFGKELMIPFNRRGKDIIDRSVRVCGFFDNGDRLKGVISVANCHPVCNTDMDISADYPAILTKRAAEQYPGVPFIFLQGRGADIDPHFKGETRTQMHEKLGKEYADSVFYAISTMAGDGLADGSIQSLYKTFEIPMKYPTYEEIRNGLERYKSEIISVSCDNDRRYAAVELNWHMKALSSVTDKGNISIYTDFQIISIGGAAVFVFIPFELLTATGNKLEGILSKLGYNSKQIFIIGCSNGTNGYLAPSDECVDSGYEISGAAHWYGLPECCAESEKAVIEIVSEMAAEL